jgi:hypothetical protein
MRNDLPELETFLAEDCEDGQDRLPIVLLALSLALVLTSIFLGR